LLIATFKPNIWKVCPLKTIIGIVRGTTQNNNIRALESLHISDSIIKKVMKIIHQMVMKYLTYLVLNKTKSNNKTKTCATFLEQR